MSAPADADLLDAANWTISNKLPFDLDWLPKGWDRQQGSPAGWREGNIVVDPDGQLWDIMTLKPGPSPRKRWRACA